MPNNIDTNNNPFHRRNRNSAHDFSLMPRRPRRKFKSRDSVILWECHNGANQNWLYSKDFNGYITFSLKYGGTTTVMDVPGGIKENGTKIIMWTKNNGNNQKWIWDSEHNAIKNVYTGKCLDVHNNSGYGGLQLQQLDCHGGDAQKFDFS